MVFYDNTKKKNGIKKLDIICTIFGFISCQSSMTNFIWNLDGLLYIYLFIFNILI